MYLVNLSKSGRGAHQNHVNVRDGTWTVEGGGVRGVSQMTILLHKPYLVKATTKGEGGSKISKNLTTWFMDDLKTKINKKVKAKKIKKIEFKKWYPFPKCLDAFITWRGR